MTISWISHFRELCSILRRSVMQLDNMLGRRAKESRGRGMPSVEILVRASSSVSRAALVPLTGRGGMILMDLHGVEIWCITWKRYAAADLSVVSVGGQGHQAEVNQVPSGWSQAEVSRATNEAFF